MTQRLALPQSLEPVAALLRAQRVGRIAGALMCVLAATLFELPESRAFDDWMNMTGPDGPIVSILRVPSFGFLVAGAWLLVTGVRRRPEDAPILRLLVEAPASIVWVHANFAVEKRAYGATVGRTRFLFLLTTAKTAEQIEVSEQGLAKVLDGLEAYLPHATFGFTEERKKRYAEDPEALRVKGTDTAYRGKGAADTARLRPAPGAPYGAGAALVLALVVVRMVLLAPSCSHESTSRSHDPAAVAPQAALSPYAVPATATPARVALPGDVVVSDTDAYYSAPEDGNLFARSKVGHDTRTIVHHDPSLGAIAASGTALYYMLGQALWVVPKPFDEPKKVAEGLVDAYRVVIAGKHAYALVADGVDRVDLKTGEVSLAVPTRHKVIATDGARALFYDETLKAMDDRSGKVTALLAEPTWIDAIAASSSFVYFTRSPDGMLFSLADPKLPIGVVPNGSALACDAEAVYWVDASGPTPVIKRRSRSGQVDVVVKGLPYNAQLAVDKDEVWYTVPGNVRHEDKRTKVR